SAGGDGATAGLGRLDGVHYHPEEEVPEPLPSNRSDYGRDSGASRPRSWLRRVSHRRHQAGCLHVLNQADQDARPGTSRCRIELGRLLVTPFGYDGHGDVSRAASRGSPRSTGECAMHRIVGTMLMLMLGVTIVAAEGQSQDKQPATPEQR